MLQKTAPQRRLVANICPETLGRAVAAALRGELVIDPRVARCIGISAIDERRLVFSRLVR